MKYFDRMTDKELCTRILRGLDVLHDQVQRNDAELAATDLNTILQALSALRRHGPLSETAAKEIGCTNFHPPDFQKFRCVFHPSKRVEFRALEVLHKLVL